MKFVIGLVIALIALLILSSCQASKSGVIEKNRNKQEETTQENNAPTLISLRMGSCRGNCKNYEVRIFENQKAIYKGKKGTDKVGLYQCQVGNEELEVLKNLFKELEFKNLQDEYIKKGVADLQMLTISYRDKTIKFQNRKAPEKLKTLFEKMDNEVNKLSWKK